ncbi:MAG: hypothetical protein WBG71_04840 [Leeuwenhoekiella sp.]
MENFIISLVAGILSGIFASYFFLMFYLRNKRPKIAISPFISKVESNGEITFQFKFINQTNSEIFDVYFEPTFYKPFGDFNGRNLQSTDIPLKDNSLSYIPFKKENDIHNLHAMRIRTSVNLENQWTDDSSFIRLTIIAKHSLSGLNKVFVHDFLTKDCITTKKFLSGDNLEVK